MIEPVLPSYGRGHKIIDIWTRDIVIRFLEIRAMERWRIKKTQAAYLISVMVKRRGIKLSTRQVLDIFNSHHTLGARVVAFMMAAVPDDEPPSAV
jgi:hypothetical protein